MVEAWTPLTFGIITSKPSQCKLDTKHTDKYSEMTYSFTIDQTLGCAAENCGNQGYYHKITISPHVSVNSNSSASSSSSSSTPGSKEGENNYYIRCQNYAGQTNAAEFAVKMKVNSGPDLTPPLVTRFVPASGSYVKVGQNSSNILFFVNEPSECKYSQEVDNRFEEMTGNATCMTDENIAIAGEWPCFIKLNNIKTGDNHVYVQCQDQPNKDERTSTMRNINRNSKDYIIKGCSVGLNITSLSPTNQIVAGKSPISATITAETSGCVNSGEATCYYSFAFDANFSYIAFLNTGGKKHSQLFDSLPAGNHSIKIKCEDEAGNTAYGKINADVFLDNFAPIVTRTYDLEKKLIVSTNENSICKYSTNNTLGCEFTFDESNLTLMTGSEKVHYTNWLDNEDYYIKCMDIFGNYNSGCGIIVRTY